MKKGAQTKRALKGNENALLSLIFSTTKNVRLQLSLGVKAWQKEEKAPETALTKAEKFSR